MRVLVAGSTGALGIPTVRALLEAGHEVFGLTRTETKAEQLRSMGAAPVIGDVFDAEGIRKIFDESRPEGVLQLLNALPKRGPFRPRELEGTNRLRIEGTRNVLAAAQESGVKRFVAESMIFGYGYGHQGTELITEDRPFAEPSDFALAQPALDAMKNLEGQVLSNKNGVEGVILRYGVFYGPGVGSTDFMISLMKKHLFILPGGGEATGSWIHVEDGASAAVAALERAPAGGIYNVVDDEPASIHDYSLFMSKTLGLPKPKRVPMWVSRVGGAYLALMAKSHLPVSNEKIKADLSWKPRYPTYREGIETLLV